MDIYEVTPPVSEFTKNVIRKKVKFGLRHFDIFERNMIFIFSLESLSYYWYKLLCLFGNDSIDYVTVDSSSLQHQDQRMIKSFSLRDDELFQFFPVSGLVWISRPKLSSRSQNMCNFCISLVKKGQMRWKEVGWVVQRFSRLGFWDVIGCKVMWGDVMGSDIASYK